MRHNAMKLGIGALLTMLATTACSRHSVQEMESEAMLSGPATLVVENQEFPDFDIFVQTEAGMKFRLGLATGHATTTFEIPKTIIDGGSAHLYFIADPVAGRAAEVGEMVVVNPGDEIGLTIAPY